MYNVTNTVTLKEYIKQESRNLIGHLTKLKNVVPNKILRIKSIMSGSKVNYESLEDSLIDLINYTAFCYAEIKTKEEEKHA